MAIARSSFRSLCESRITLKLSSQAPAKFKADFAQHPERHRAHKIPQILRLPCGLLRPLRIHPIDKAALCSRTMRRMMLKTPAFGLKLKAIARITDRPAYRQSLSPQA